MRRRWASRFLIALLFTLAAAFISPCSFSQTNTIPGPRAIIRATPPPRLLPITPPAAIPFIPTNSAVLTGGGLSFKVGDLITVTFFDTEPPLQPHEERIRDNGEITLPLIGAVKAAGKSAGELQKEIHDRYVPKCYRRLTVMVMLGNPARAVMEAFNRNDAVEVGRLLDQFPGRADDLLRLHGESAAGRAVIFIRPEMLAVLLKHGANPNEPWGNNATTPLHLALERRGWAMATNLLAAGADATRTNATGQTPLVLFMDQWWPGQLNDAASDELLRQLLDRGADQFDPIRVGDPTSIVESTLSKRGDAVSDLLLTNRPGINRRTPGGDTALHLAALWWRTNALDFLLSAGFSVNQTNGDGLTPLQAVTAARVSGAGIAGFPANVQIAWQGRAIRGPMPGSPGVPMSELLLARGATLDVFSAAGLGLTNELAGFLRTNPALANARDGLGRTPLHYAVFANQVASAERLLEAGAETSLASLKPARLPNAGAVPAGMTPLHLAARNGSPGLVKALLFKSADVRAADADGNTPLHIAAANWETNCVRLFILAKSPLEVTNRAGRTPLRMAVETGFTGNAEALLDAGARTDVNPDGSTLLHVAAERGRTDVISILLKRRLALDVRDAEGCTPLWRAVVRRQWNAMNLLQSKGAKINAANTNGNTALHQVMTQMDDNVGHQIDLRFWQRWQQNWMRRPGVVRDTLQKLIKAKLLPQPAINTWTNTSLTAWLIEHDANVNLTNRTGQTPLHILCGQNWISWSANPHTNRIARLLQAGARADIPDAQGVIPLQLAARNSAPETLAMLIERSGKAVNARDRDGRSVLDYALRNERHSATNLSLLLSRGVDPNARDTNGLTLLHRAVTNADWRPQPAQYVKALLDVKARPDLPDRFGRTPLHWLAAGTSQNTMTNAALLLAHGANPNVRDAEGFTPLHFAATNRHWNVRRAQFVEMLLQHGAQPDLTNNLGQTALLMLADSIAAGDFFQGATESAEALLRAGADPSRPDANGQLFLHTLVHKSRGWANIRDICGNVLKRHPELINATNAAGDTLLHVALRDGNYMMTQMLTERRADVTRRNGQGESALLLAAKQPNSSMAWQVRPPGTTDSFWNTLMRRDYRQFEIWLRAEPRLAEVPLPNGQSPLAFASGQRLTNVVSLLIKSGAPIEPIYAMHTGLTNELRQMLQQSNRLSSALLASAIFSHQFESIQDLAATRGDLWTTNPCDKSLLYDALDRGQGRVAEWLREHGVKLMLLDAVKLGETNVLLGCLSTNRGLASHACPDGWSMLMQAARGDQADAARILLAHGADANGRGAHEWTPLHIAAMWNSDEVAAALFAAGAQTDAGDDHGLTPLHHAARAGSTSVLKLLIEHRANVNLGHTNTADNMVTMPAGSTALHWAAHGGRLDAVRVLLAHGADPKLTNARGETALDLVRTNRSSPHYHYGWVTFREPPSGDPVRTKIATLLTRSVADNSAGAEK